MRSKVRRRRAAVGGFAATLAACGVALLAGMPAQAAVTSYPSGGSTFDADPDGWSGGAGTCSTSLLGIPLPDLLPALCNANAVHDPTAGNPAGSISSRADATLNLLAIFNGQSTWTSPEFTVASGAPTGATLSLDRALSAGALLNIGLTSEYTVTLHNLTAGTSTDVLNETLAQGDSAFVTQGQGVQVVPGNRYRIQITTQTSSTLALGSLGLGLLNSTANTRFDNVRLTVETADGPNGPDGPGSDQGGPVPVVSPGVRVVRGPLTNVEIHNVLDRYGTSLNANVGKGPDGSIVRLEECTIIGTSGPDVIRGTSGHDVICGLGGNDRIIGGGGRDVIDAANGNDRVNGGPGGDLIFGLRGNDRLFGDAGNDGIGGGAGRDVIDGGSGRDRLNGANGNDRVRGRGGSDRIAGGRGNDRLNGGPGSDRIAGGPGNDVIVGGPGRDRLLGGPGNDRIGARGGQRDVVRGGRGRDRAAVDRSDNVRGVQRIAVR